MMHLLGFSVSEPANQWFAELMAKDRDVGRRIDAYSDKIASYLQHHNGNVAADTYFLTGLPTEDEHGDPP